jgi:hypothetical protein
MTRSLPWLLVLAAGCSGGDDGPPPLAKVPGKLGTIAVGSASIFAIDTTDSTIVELGLDGTMIGKLETIGAVTELSAAGDLVAWVEKEGNNGKLKRRKAGAIEALGTLTFSPKPIVTAEGVVYSDTGIIGLWADAVPVRIATPAAGATLIGVDSSFAYTLEGQTVQKYDRRMDMKEMVVPSASAATVSAGLLAYRTGEGVRIHDVFTQFDHAYGAPPAGYTCDLLIAGRAVMCGKYRCLDEVTDELLDDPVAGYTAVGRDIYWVKVDGSTSEVFKVDAEQMAEN